MVYQWFGLKTTGTVFTGLVSKPVVTVFSGLASKPVAWVFRFGPQNHHDSFLVWISKHVALVSSQRSHQP
jgi:hypothetical protein